MEKTVLLASEQIEGMGNPGGLDDATFEPQASIEQMVDFRQAETIQNGFTQIMENTTSHAAGLVTSGENPGSASGGQVSITPINLPDIAQSEGGELKGPSGGQVGINPAIHEGSSVPATVPNEERMPTPEGEKQMGGARFLSGSGDHANNVSDADIVNHMISQATETMQEMQMSFNLQYLTLQHKISHENRQFSMVSNIMKNKHDTAKNSINNIR